MILITVLLKLLDSSTDASVNNKLKEITTEQSGLTALGRSSRFNLDEAAQEEIFKYLRPLYKLNMIIESPCA